MALKKYQQELADSCTYQERLFAYRYVIENFNGTEAYMQTFNCRSRRTAAVEATRLMKSARVRSFIESIMEPVYDKYAISSKRILEELASIAFSEITDVAKIEDGEFQMHDTDDNDPRANAAIAEISVIGGRTTFKMYDKTKALQLLGKYHGMEMDFNQIVMSLLQYGYQVVQDAETGELSLKSTRKNTLPFDLGDHVIIDAVETKTTAELEPATEVDIDDEPDIEPEMELLVEMPMSERQQKELDALGQMVEEKLKPKDGIYRTNPYK